MPDGIVTKGLLSGEVAECLRVLNAPQFKPLIAALHEENAAGIEGLMKLQNDTQLRQLQGKTLFIDSFLRMVAASVG